MDIGRLVVPKNFIIFTSKNIVIMPIKVNKNMDIYFAETMCILFMGRLFKSISAFSSYKIAFVINTKVIRIGRKVYMLAPRFLKFRSIGREHMIPVIKLFFCINISFKIRFAIIKTSFPYKSLFL
jgi:hypothetical protein